MAWNNSGCLYNWNGSSWQFDNMCRTARENPLDYDYHEGSSGGKVLFLAITDPSLNLVWWTDTKLGYQQLTNSGPNEFAGTTFGLQQASYDGVRLQSTDDFFADIAGAQAFKAVNPGVDMSRTARDAGWSRFKEVWYPKIAARNCTPADLCP